MLLKDAIMEYLLECGIMRLEDVKPAHLRRFLLEKEDLGRKPQYINDLLKVFKTFFRYACTAGMTCQPLTVLCPSGIMS